MKRGMMRYLALAGVILCVGAVSTVIAATGTTTEADHTHLTGAWLDTFHNPMEGVEMGLDVRIREIYGRNLLSMNEDQMANKGAQVGYYPNENAWHRGRYRLRWSAKVNLATDLDFNARLMWEFDNWDDPGSKDQHVDFDEGVFDIFNITWRNAFDMPLTIVAGRQEIILGNGWLVLDGTPADGFRTIYFDALRATYNFTEETKIDLIGIVQYDAEDKWLQPINHREGWRHVTQKQDEKGFIAYITDKSLVPGQTTELYYIWKADEPSNWSKMHSTAGIDDEIHTIGGALSGPINDNWSYRAEVAKQWGKKNLDTMSGLGFNSRAVYTFHDERDSSLHFDYEYLSGNDPHKGGNQAFDPLWGEWPQANRGGDLQSYLWACEAGLGEVTNLHRAGIGHTFTVAPKWTLQTDYNLMWADQNTRGDIGLGGLGPTGTVFNGEGKFRGQMITGYLKYKCCKQLSMHFLCDYFQPGTFFDGSTQDHALFLRFQFEYTF
ncbi:MAG: alginate export family protein [Sedimentisphaerales bacterium]|nr:alginate export family protein [Sedimentisphaerales bacterium]